jgi:hypothetical protein
MKLQISKKSQGHIEIILSFVLFIAFLLIIFLFLGDLLKNRSNASKNIYDIEKEIISRISEKIAKRDVILENNSKCYSMDNEGKNISEILIFNKEKKIYSVYFSNLLVQNAPHYDPNCNDNFSLGVYYFEDIVFIPKIKTLKTEYEDNYGELKESLGKNNDFSFSLKTSNGNLIQELSVDKQIPKNREVFSLDRDIIALNETGDSSDLVLNLKIW